MDCRRMEEEGKGKVEVRLTEVEALLLEGPSSQRGCQGGRYRYECCKSGMTMLQWTYSC